MMGDKMVARWVLVSSFLFLLAACSNKEKAAEPEKPLAVRVAEVGRADQINQIDVIGTALWRIETPLGFTSAGQISQVLVNEGDRVRRGQLLALLDTTPVQADLAAAQAEARRSDADVARLSTLFKQGWVTKARLEAAQAGADTASAAVRARQFALQTAKIVAPSDGVILSRTAEPTQVVAAGTPIVTLGEAKAGYVFRAPLNDRLASRIGVGSPATVRFQALGDDALQGRVVEIGGKASRATGTFDVEIGLPSDRRIRSGMIGNAKILGGGGLISFPRLPAAAVIAPRAGEALVYVIDAKNVARLRTVQIGDPSDQGVEVKSGIALGERVAMTGLDRIRDGMTVQPVARGQ
jgi:RND family efflux transporter MFP subunit